ncbi:metallophosphoesterase family protein [Rhodothermus bifroesti]|nr:metallophosphoesterase [Rhodothermus bifroesti]
MRMRLLHLSDLHFGRLASQTIVADLLAEARRQAPDLVVVSGDLTQRARPRQFQAARAFLEALPAPWLVVPGNHDVYPWWRPLSRLWRSLARYRHYITQSLRPSWVTDTIALLGLNTAHGATIKGGRLTTEDLTYLQTFFAAAPPQALRILVIHHHLVHLQDIGPHDVVRDARQALEAVAQAGIHVILCGHLHIAHVAPVLLQPQWQLLVVSAGTATSSRGRGPHRHQNFYNLLEVTPQTLRIETYRYHPEARTFTLTQTQTFERQGAQLLLETAQTG